MGGSWDKDFLKYTQSEIYKFIVISAEEYKKTIGRPSKYFGTFTPEKEKEILASYTLGKTDVSAMLILNIARETFYAWLKDEKRPEFSNCIKKGRLLAQEVWEQIGQDGVAAGQLNAGIYCFIKKNRFKEDYGDHKADVQVTNNYYDVDVPKRASEKEWLKAQEGDE